MLRQYFIATTIFLLLASNGSVAYAFNTNTTEEVRQAVETYTKIEFELGDPEKREKIIKFSTKREAELQKESPREWVYVTFGYYDKIVVSAYHIGEIKITGSRASAKVDYQRLAHSEGNTDDTWHLIAEPPHDESITLNLVFKKNKWWVLDPPPPRVSKDVLIQNYEETIKSLGVENHPKWQKERDTVKLLKSLQ